MEKLKGMPGRYVQSWKPGDVRLKKAGAGPAREEKQELLGVPMKVVPGCLRPRRVEVAEVLSVDSVDRARRGVEEAPPPGHLRVREN